MRARTHRWFLAALLCCVGVGLLAGPAAAAHAAGPEPPGGSLEVGVGVETGHGGGSGSWDCTSDGMPSHSCDKDGELESDAASVDYYGDNYGDRSAMTGGGGDHVTVSAGGQEAGGGFDCDFAAAAPSNDTCTVSTTAPAGADGGDGDGDSAGESGADGSNGDDRGRASDDSDGGDESGASDEAASGGANDAATGR